MANLANTVRRQPAVRKKITVDGLKRSYLLYVPEAAQKPAPLVLVIHGSQGTGRQMEHYTEFDDLAAREGFVVVYPESIGGNWNDGRGVPLFRSQREDIDDVKYVRAVLEDVERHVSIDRSRVFAAGISNGGFMAHRLAAEASDLVAAIAPVVGGIAPAVFEKFAPEFPVSILIIQGDADPVIPIDGGTVAANLGPDRGKMIATSDTLAKYVERNGNPREPTIVAQDNDPHDGTSVEIRKYPDGPGGIKTEFYLVKGGGHTWPGRPRYAPERMIGKASQEFSATQVIWDFFKSCPPRTR